MCVCIYKHPAAVRLAQESRVEVLWLYTYAELNETKITTPKFLSISAYSVVPQHYIAAITTAIFIIIDGNKLS